MIGARNAMDFRLRYAEWIIRQRGTMKRIPQDQAFINGRLRKGLFMQLKKDKDDKPIYKNLDDLEKRTSWRTSRVTQREAFPHMPEKQYQRFYVDLDPEQLRIYNELAEEYHATLMERTLEVPLLLTRFIRLQQVISGYLPLPMDIDVDPDFDFFAPFDGNRDIKVKYEIVRIPGAEARVAMLDEILRKRSGDPAIVWCRFKPDIDLLMQFFKEKNIYAERYDGSVRQEVRDRVKLEFGTGNIPVLVGNQKAGGTGLTLKPAQTVVYFSNYYGFRERAQSEDRPIHGELQRPVLYADIVARYTLEEKLVDSLQNKRDIFQELMGDRKRIEAWFSKAA
jgi:SNF2 family DNA or RNA helicase